jgi:hypothetical protein
MLHTKTVEPGTLSVLKQLMALHELEEFSLVGGTALSLRWGHRKSIDLDLFSHERKDFIELAAILSSEFGNTFVYEKSPVKFGIFCYIDDVKVDIIHYPHLPIRQTETIEDIRLYQDADIAAMKIQAILGRGRKKDFWDMYELLHHYTLDDIIQWHQQKYPNRMLLISIPQALIYFNDAEESEEPVSLKGQTWQGVKQFIQKKVSEYLR